MIEGFLCSGCKPTSLKTCVLCKPWQACARIELMVQRTHSASATMLRKWHCVCFEEEGSKSVQGN